MTVANPFVLDDYLPPRPTLGRQLRRWFGHRGFALGAVLLVIIVFAALAAPCWRPTTPMPRT